LRIVREDFENFPPRKSNVYALDENLRRRWTADQPEIIDVYTDLILKGDSIYAVSQSKCLCKLDPATGSITDIRPVSQTVSFGTPDFLKNPGAWKSFFSLAGGSILYCLSALLIMYGIVQIMGSVLAANNGLKECLPYIGVLNLYEVSLLGVLLLIVVWCNVTDDAISLVILTTLFLLGNGIALDTMAPRGPRTVLHIGIVCFMLAIVKLGILKRFILARLGTISLVAAGIILLWNFVCGPIFAIQKMGATAEIGLRREPWVAVWFVVLGAAVMVFSEAAKTPTRKEPAQNSEPFLRTYLMGLIFMLLVLAAAGIHQYTLAYLFTQKYSFGDFIPLICVGSLLLVELLRHTGKPLTEAQIIVACIPLGATLFGIMGNAITASAAINLNLLWYPPVMLALTGAGLCWLAVLNRCPWMLYVAATYGIGVIFTLGFSPLKPYEVNWRLTGAALTLILMGLGIWLRNGNLCFIAVFIATIGLGTTDPFQDFAEGTLRVEPAIAVAGLIASVTLLIYVIGHKKLERAIAILAALALMIFLFNFLPSKMGWQDLPAVIGIVGLSTALGFRTKDLAAIIPI